MGDIYEDVEDAHPLGVDGANEPSSNAKWGDPEFRVVYLQEDQLGGGLCQCLEIYSWRLTTQARHLKYDGWCMLI